MLNILSYRRGVKTFTQSIHLHNLPKQFDCVHTYEHYDKWIKKFAKSGYEMQLGVTIKKNITYNKIGH